ncbi:DEAD/DEAH box helicase [Arundinibacter roseus]|uniref:ATP-dependent helicase n=1 Tax=Arundinibacter roseus TaxID=2070510 RepID=A0A4R4KK83_9BACT|nr:DEAD/DEAH box helicase [Arundinibacter roseus]TDB67332.1 ATP-dependent helicase [Arundinibacter roseus]
MDKPQDAGIGPSQDAQEALLHFLSLSSQPQPADAQAVRVVVVGRHKYYEHFNAQLVEFPLSANGEFRMPYTTLQPLDLVWQAQRPDELKFYAALARFQGYYEKSPGDLEGLKALVANPFGYSFYWHDASVSEKITPRALSPIDLTKPLLDVQVRISLGEKKYHVQAELSIDGTFCPLSLLTPRFEYFLVRDHTWFLCVQPPVMQAILYFKKYHSTLLLTHDEFAGFQQQVLPELEGHVRVAHEYIKPATKIQKKSGGFDQSPQKLIYLSDLGNYVLINPVMLYGQVEIPVLTKRQIYAQDARGNYYGISRDGQAEDAFVALLIRQHADFPEQLENPLLYFYLHKSRFLDENWFLDVFEEWGENGIQVLGFNHLKGNQLNPHKAKINIQVASGLNWFNALVKVRFGRRHASLKQLHKSIKNKNKFVLLDDGTLGLIPQEWLHRLESYFSAGEVVDETIQISKIKFRTITELFEKAMLDQQVQQEIHHLQHRLSSPEAIAPAPIPEALHATLRPYQWQGLSWLDFLDDNSFGGCLADDMGLGKSVQLLAFLLLQREKHPENNTNLLVVPTSLIHNWLEEIEKFAPSLRVQVLHGPARARSSAGFADYELLLTTYGTLLSDIFFLKKFVFNYVVLDESQNIKNISSQRYKAARLLQARNRIVLSGTPMENNTFDIYAQLSFACPGLLGTRQYFRDTYAIPIDRFKEKRSAGALQALIRPFVLRRTKKEVAHELPDKTEVVLYCEMGAEQRQVYDSYEREFRDYISSNKEEEIAKNGMHVLRGITKLRQICNSPLLIKDDKLFGDASAKIERLMDQLRSLTSVHKVLVFSQFVSMLDLIKKELTRETIGFAYLTGRTQNRSEVIHQFQEDEATRVFLISLKAGGTGLNLTAADYVFLVDPWWNPAVENQAIDRSYRIGQQKNVIAVRLICPDTVEEKIQVMQQNKAKLATDLIGTDESFFKSLTKADWLGLAGG